ncbi:MAG TPA: class I SAM-dependent methyltransferase, partial [Anaeromyxobacter sp.]|nr:class I SAM-dependent methyltransferase [Anaeromyxobacter sp.]
MSRRTPLARPPRLDLVDAVVLEVHGLVHDQGWLADRALERALRRERKLWASERRLSAESVYGLIRMQGQLAFLLGGAEPGAPFRGLSLSLLYAAWLVRFGGASADEAAARLAVPPARLRGLKEAEARMAAIADPHLRLAVEGSLPRWIVERFVTELGEEEATRLVRVLNDRAPLTVRANLLHCDREALRSRLASEGVEAVPTRFSPWGLTLDGHQNAFALRSFQEGWFEIQDEGSQLIALACAARPGKVVVDACAGAGGKALALSAEMHNRGTLWALDADSERLSEARRRARRAGVDNL